jgi:hypothetical protein
MKCALCGCMAHKPLCGACGKPSLRRVNRELAQRGYQETLERGMACYHFTGGTSASWPATGVLVAGVSQLTVEEWMAERNRLATATSKESFPECAISA